MTKCPFCREQIPDDSWYCDQCGKELKWCPECRQPKRGTECAACGETLISSPTTQAVPAVKSSSDVAAKNGISHLEGNGWKLMLVEGEFGRTGGIWDELSTIRYVSGTHGRLRKNGISWEIMDCGSTNGTFINGVRLEPGQWSVIKSGDIIKIATVKFNVN